VQNFISAAVGMAVLIAVIRGFVARSGRELGNFWADLTRALLYIVVPISVVVGVLLIPQGALQALAPYVTNHTLTGGEQTLALGPVGSQEIIKELGTSGGGFFNVNSAMPFENPRRQRWRDLLRGRRQPHRSGEGRCIERRLRGRRDGLPRRELERSDRVEPLRRPRDQQRRERARHGAGRRRRRLRRRQRRRLVLAVLVGQPLRVWHPQPQRQRLPRHAGGTRSWYTAIATAKSSFQPSLNVEIRP